MGQDAQPSPLVRAEINREPATRKRILVVDDEPAMRRLLHRIFAEEGYQVSQAADGSEALDELRFSQPDLVVIDLMMPVMSGLEFATHCHQIDGCGDLPIILLSAMYRASKPSGGGVSAWLGKPFDVQELLALVELHARPTPAPAATGLTPMWPPRGPARVLLVLDQPLVVEVAKLTLGHGAYDLRTVTSTADAVAALAAWQPHLVLLETELDGEAIMHQGVPVIALTSRGDLQGEMAAFEAGVDDVLTLPFAPDELLARVTAVLRRSYGDTVAFTPVIEVDRLKLDILNRTVQAGTSELHLTSLEQNLLYLLAANAGRVLSRREIGRSLWGPDFFANHTIVDRQVRNLRARLLNVSQRRQFIATVPGRGYRFLPTLTAVAQPA